MVRSYGFSPPPCVIFAVNRYWLFPVTVGSATVSSPTTDPCGVGPLVGVGRAPMKGMPLQSPIAVALAAASATFRAPAGTIAEPPPDFATRTALVALKLSAVSSTGGDWDGRAPAE